MEGARCVAFHKASPPPAGDGAVRIYCQKTSSNYSISLLRVL